MPSGRRFKHWPIAEWAKLVRAKRVEAAEWAGEHQLAIPTDQHITRSAGGARREQAWAAVAAATEGT